MRFFEGLPDPLGTVLGRFWLHFGRVLEVKIDANIDPSENVKIELPSKRESKIQGLEGIEKHQKSLLKALNKQAPSKMPR